MTGLLTGGERARAGVGAPGISTRILSPAGEARDGVAGPSSFQVHAGGEGRVGPMRMITSTSGSASARQHESSGSSAVTARERVAGLRGGWRVMVAVVRPPRTARRRTSRGLPRLHPRRAAAYGYRGRHAADRCGARGAGPRGRGGVAGTIGGWRAGRGGMTPPEAGRRGAALIDDAQALVDEVPAPTRRRFPRRVRRRRPRRVHGALRRPRPVARPGRRAGPAGTGPEPANVSRRGDGTIVNVTFLGDGAS